MRKNYFLSLFLLMTAFWHVQASDGSKSTNPNGNSANTTMFVAPVAPTGLAGTPVGGNSTRIALTWNDNSLDESEFQIAYTTLPTGYSFETTSVTNNSAIGGITLTGLQPNTLYYIWVRALKNGVETPPTCTPQANMPTDGPPPGKSASCWSNLVMVSTNQALPAAVTGATVATPYSQRTNTLYFFDNSNNETEFVIERTTGGNYTQIAVIPGVAGTGQRMYVDNTTQPNTSYSYRVTSRNSAGIALPESKTDFFLTLPDPPLAPSNPSLTQDGLGLNFIRFFWINNASNATGFLIQQSVDNNTWVTVGSIPSGDPSFKAENLIEGQRYFFRVIAFNTGGNSAPSGLLVATTLKRVAPNPAFNLAAKTISTTQIDLTWNLGTQDGVTNNRVSQEIYRSSLSATDGFIRIATIGDYEASYSDKTGTPKTKYWYKILTANFQGQSPYSNVATATTLGPPFAPSNLTAVLANDALGNTVIKTTWKDNSDDEWGFTLERSTDSTFATGVLKADLDSNSVAATSIPIEEGLIYYFRVNASNKYGSSKYSATTKLDVVVSAAPNAPYDLKGTATASEVALKWGDDSNKEAAFDVERSADGITFTKLASTGRNEVSYVDKTVAEKTKYFYRVRATNVKGNSDYTNVLQVTTPAKVSASIDLVAEDVFQVYPNPTADAVKVSVSENMLKESGMIIITDKSNRVISKTLLTSNQSEYRLDLSNYSEGTYTISLRTATQQITKRVYKF
ncbi:fibronectin type III domain-containing protein [Emticicia sp. W12TSBA100-4]|uniref:fibronectin type III domain-containing protein n=1 Tax=Emticicia sp. W12TSBA100-4 TaxID=3160965 RepID=UPI00330572BD